jgi:hypothetical protein
MDCFQRNRVRMCSESSDWSVWNVKLTNVCEMLSISSNYNAFSYRVKSCLWEMSIIAISAFAIAENKPRDCCFNEHSTVIPTTTKYALVFSSLFDWWKIKNVAITCWNQMSCCVCRFNQHVSFDIPNFSLFSSDLLSVPGKSTVGWWASSASHGLYLFGDMGQVRANGD